MEISRFKILVVDDSKPFLDSVVTALKTFQVQTASSIDEAKNALSNSIDLVLLDLVFDDNNPDDLQGMQLLKFIHENYPELQVIIMTNYTSTDITVQAIKAGASDFLNKKDLNWGEWKIRLENYCKNSVRIKQLSEKNKELESKYSDSEIIGISKEIDFVRKRLKDLAENSEDVPIFITGETGTGKNLAVKYYRTYSTRKDKTYKEFSISELSETVLESELFGHLKGAFTGAEKDKKGLFEDADGGILFLDEIGDYDLKIQKKIMRFIEDKTITPVGSTQSKVLNVQLIMATNQDIPKLINDGKFREDLFQRMNRVRIELPPLRERKEDIKYLTDYFFNHFKEKEKTNLKSINTEVHETLEKYKWQGNVRELQSVIWDACTKARLFKDKTLQFKHIKKEIFIGAEIINGNDGKVDSIEIRKALLELEEIEKALEKSNGKKTDAAKLLNLSLDQLRYKIFKAANFNLEAFKKYSYINKAYKIQ